MTLDSPLTDIKGIGQQLAKKFMALGIKTARNLIDHYPRRFEDYSNIQTIKQIKPGMVTIKATIKQSAGRYVSRGLHITEAIASDDTGSVRLIWFNQPYRSAAIKGNQEYYISGEFALRRQRLSIQNPSAELVSNFPLNTARMVPVYKETKGLKSGQVRKALNELRPIIKELPETLPAWIVNGERLLSRSEAIVQIHFPESANDLAAARRRLGFEEVFQLTLAALLNKYQLLTEQAPVIPFQEDVARSFVSHLPFTLTDAQRRIIWQIYKDIQKPQPMNRLIEGDVGSGKTVVAAMAALMAINQGQQVAFMAPTELLARQHAHTLFNLYGPLGMSETVGLLVGGLKSASKAEAHNRISVGDIKLVVGTHALIQEKTDMHNLALVIVDEQHRFGVEQRKKLQAKAGHMPHLLSMTATPIPRSLALTLYGELDISVLDVKPADRKPVRSKVVPLVGRQKAYMHVEEQLGLGRQAFVVCPLITESEFMASKSAEQVYEELKTGLFKHRRVALLHGKLKPADKDKIMQAFVKHDYDLLVSTTVIEVGVDVPNASVMVIENADRFGLAQLHQLRGRVGRSDQQGYCYLVLSDNSAPSIRMRALESSSDGFKLAEYDLQLRGPGAIYGTMQHGQLDLRVAKLTDTRLIASARSRAQEFIDRKEDLVQYRELYEHVRNNRAVTNLN
ncbi:MAG TPA: ATP-dependent DNA helicase RecG [Candidatus Limnocylindrales bacterium]|nr:ATP-dependent DNA helicase RecG [Candidatus Limnocylindrales bacterium]